jgi:hypothetical protein
MLGFMWRRKMNYEKRFEENRIAWKGKGRL